MPRRYRFLIGLTGVGLCALLIWYFASTSSVFRKSYQGQLLQDWTRHYGHATNQEARLVALTAIRAIGTNKIPELVKALSYNPYSGSERMLWIKRQIPWWAVRNLRLRKMEEQQTATAALCILGAEAAPAIPQVQKLISDCNDELVLRNALWVLPRLGTNGFACLLSIMANETNAARWYAIDIFSSACPYLGTNADAALPVLLRATEGNDLGAVGVASKALGALRIEPAKTVPALLAVISRSDPTYGASARYPAISSLGQFGGEARMAVPELVRLLDSQYLDTRIAASNALRKIAPESLPEPSEPPMSGGANR